MLFRLFFKAWIRTALWFRFRKIQWVFHGTVPMEEPAIIAGNHQNALLDSITLASSSPRIPYTLSRGSLFGGRVSQALLGAFQMIPVYRFRDGFGKMRKNAEVFRQFVEVLGKDQWLLIFPEGNHELRYSLRRLQKGIARIVFAAQESEGWAREIPIVPVGMQYEAHTGIGGRLLIQFGSPVSSLAFKAGHAENYKKAERELTAEVFEALKPLLVLPPEDEEGYQAALRRWVPNKGRFPDLMDQFRSDKEIVEGGTEAPTGVGPAGTLLKKLAGYLLSLPGLVTHLPGTILAFGLVEALVRDRGLIPAARFLAAMFVYPVWYLVAFGFAYGLAGSVSLPLLLMVLMLSSLWLWSRTWQWTR